MEASGAPVRRTLTPAVAASIAFLVVCTAIAVTFVAAHGGLQMPVAGSLPPVAVTSPGTSEGGGGSATAGATGQPFPSEPGPPATATPGPSVPPSQPLPSSSPGATPPNLPGQSLAPGDPLLALPPCPGFPGCAEYTVRRGDTLSGIATRYGIPLLTLLALNPEVADRSTIVVDQTLYLGRSPFVRLDRCPDGADCWLYVIRPGDRLATIANRFGLTVDAIQAANPGLSDPNLILSGQTLRLPRPAQQT